MAKKELAQEKQQDNFNLSEFANETKEELAKVVWPSRRQRLRCEHAAPG